MFKLSHFLLRNSLNSNRLPCLTRLSLSSVVAEAKNKTSEQEDSVSANKTASLNVSRPSKNIVAAAFASLNTDDTTIEGINTPLTDDKISKATSIDEILSISTGNGVSRKHALRVVSVLADWTTQGKISLKEFEGDPRFIRLCKVLTKTNSVKNMRTTLASRSEDLSTVLSVTADDEAAKLVSSITVPQMVKVMATLSSKKRRSTLLLRTLAYNITASSERLDLKQSGDLLFSMASLNFPDENLLRKVASDICQELEGNIKSSVVGSILTSIGLLRYKNDGLIDALCDWVLKNHSVCRPQDLFSAFMTLAVLNYSPINADNFFETLIPQLTESEAGKAHVWLDIVWSLALLNKASKQHLTSVLEKTFVDQILAEYSTSMSVKLKLLNINGVALQLENYDGPKIAPNHELVSLTIARTREKNEMVGALVDSLKNLIQSENCLRYNVNTGLGFYIDAECILDKKCHPLLLNEGTKDGTRIAIMAYDYHDMCRGRIEPTGINVLAKNLLQGQGYKVLEVPYTDFKSRDKLIHRVKYLETKLKEIVNC